MIIALAEMNIAWEDKLANLNKVRLFVKLLAKTTLPGTDPAEPRLILFPEMTLTGFSMNTAKTAEYDRETVHIIKELARTENVYIGIGWVRGSRADKHCENHYSIIDADEGTILDYVKLHPFSMGGEDDYFKAGNNLPVCRIGDMTLGAQICYDLRFPLPFQKLADQAEFIAVSANWPSARSGHWRALLKARAIENQCYVAGVNCIGKMNGSRYPGQSAVFDPLGRRLKPDMELDLAEMLPAASVSELRVHITKGDKLRIYYIENNVMELRDSFPIRDDRHKAEKYYFQGVD